MQLLTIAKTSSKFILIIILLLFYVSIFFMLWLLNTMMAFFTSKEHLGDLLIDLFLLWETDATEKRKDKEKRQFWKKFKPINMLFVFLLKTIKSW